MTRALLDTSVVVDLDDPGLLDGLPDESAISAVTLAQLAAGPHLASSVEERARRQLRLQQVEATFAPIPFDTMVARSYGQIVAALEEQLPASPQRTADLMIAATALAHGLSLYTREATRLSGLGNLVAIISI